LIEEVKMILISHRGNLGGKIEGRENSPSYIEQAIREGYDVEIDARLIQNFVWLGHDEPQYQVDAYWLNKYKDNLWIHSKNLSALFYFKNLGFNTFYHDKDSATLTSKGYVWCYPGKDTSGGICVLPEWNDFDVADGVIGICSDYIERWRS
jgi:hypothetical protein